MRTLIIHYSIVIIHFLPYRGESSGTVGGFGVPPFTPDITG
jgi:hypothetical protein